MFEGIKPEHLGEFITALAESSTKDVKPMFVRTNALTQQPIVRHKCSHRYSYEPFEVWHTGNMITDEMVLIDMWRRDHEKYDAAMESVTGDHRQMNIQFTPADCTKFLQAYYDNDQIVAVQMIEYAESSNGYPNWLLRWRDDSKLKGHQREVWVDEMTTLPENSHRRASMSDYSV